MDYSVTASCSGVLVVEDDPGMGRAVTRTLVRAGYPVVLVRRCRAALQLERAFDVAVLDLDLPDGSGVDLAAHLFDRAQVQAVVFFSATGDDVHLARAAQYGKVVRKGAELNELLEAVSRARSGPMSALRERGQVANAAAAERR